MTPASDRHPPTPPDATKSWTTRRLLDWMTDAFRARNLDSPRMLAEQLLAHVLGCERIHLYTQADRPASDNERTHLRDLAARALHHEPIQYLVAEAWFYALPFHVDPRVLIPRPSTATVVDAALEHLESSPRPTRIADICTGSGAIAVAVLKNCPSARAIATDISADALDVARTNALRHAVSHRLDLLPGDLLEPLDRQEPPLDAILANPPYIPDREWPDVEPNVADHEPHTALRAGPDGLDFIRPLLAGAPSLLRPGGLLAIEIAACHKDTVLALANAHPHLQDSRVLDDIDRLPRVLVALRA